jgi:HEPN domain-containing protein
MSEEMEVARQWLAKARNDLLNADNNLRAEEIPLDTVCFHCQQAAEKLLKGYLAARGYRPPAAHDLFILLEKILPLDATVERLRPSLGVLMPYAVEIRYPDDWFVPSLEDALESRAAAAKALGWFDRALPELTKARGSG